MSITSGDVRKDFVLATVANHFGAPSKDQSIEGRVSVQRVKSLGGHFACLCRGFEFDEVKKKCYYFSKRKRKYFYPSNNFYSEKSSKRAK